MPQGAFTAQMDVAQVVLYVFWIFFFALIIYLRREDKREGYPLLSENPYVKDVYTLPPMPAPKTFLLADGTTVDAPRDNGDKREPRSIRTRRPYGSPFKPDGDPMLAGVGPG